MSKPQLHVAVVGAGLGGLAAAIAIARGGHRVTILEQATKLGEVSTHPQISVLLFTFLLVTYKKCSGWSRNPDPPEFSKHPEELGNPRQNRSPLRTAGRICHSFLS